MSDDAGLSADARTAKRAAMRRAMLHLVLGVVVLDAIALLVYYSVIAHSSPSTLKIFVGVWTVATALLVVVLLKRVRKARFGPRIR